MELKNKVINFLGDSITEGVGASSVEARYVSRVAAIASLARANNYGISGTRIARQKNPDPANRFDLDFCLRCVEMDKEADINVVFGGTNDYGHGDAPMGRFEDRDPHTFYGACHYLFINLQKKYPGKPIVIMTPTHRLNECSRYSERDFIRGSLREYVNIIREVAEYYGLPVLDLYAMGGMQPEVDVVREMFMPDGLHPNDAGHVIIAAKLEKFLRDL